MTNGRVKGKAAEREVAAVVQTWWRQHEPAATFVRTPMSGGWVTGTSGREGFEMAADLMTTSKIFPFSIEIKRREGWSLERLKKGANKSPVKGWWTQTRTEARSNGRVPMLWFRQSRMPWLVLLPDAFVVACWDRHRAQKREENRRIGFVGPYGHGLPPIPWLFTLWGEALCFNATDLLSYPPSYFLKAA